MGFAIGRGGVVPMAGSSAPGIWMEGKRMNVEANCRKRMLATGMMTFLLVLSGVGSAHGVAPQKECFVDADCLDACWSVCLENQCVSPTTGDECESDATCDPGFIYNECFTKITIFLPNITFVVKTKFFSIMKTNKNMVFILSF